MKPAARHRRRSETLATRSDPVGVEPAGTVPLLGRMRLARNTAFSVAQQGGAMVLALMLVPAMLWALGPERYGLWLILQLFNILGLAYLAELGFQGALVRYLARFFIDGDEGAFRGLLAAGFVLFAGIGAVMGLGVIAFAQGGLVALFPIPAPHTAEMQSALTIIGAGLFVGFPALVIKAYFSARQELATTKVWELADRVLFALGVVIALQFTTSLVALVLIEQAIAIALTVLFAIRAARLGRGWFSLSLREARGSMREGHFAGLVRMSRSVFAINLSAQGIARMPELFVGALLGPVSLTAFQLATRIPRAVKTLQGSLNAAVLPHIAALDASGGAEARGGFALKGLRANYLVATPLLTAVSIFAPVLLDAWVGEQYRSLAGFLAVFAGFQALLLASNFCGATLVRQEQLRGFVRFNLAVSAVFLAALWWGLDRGGLPFLFAALIATGLALFACMLATFRTAHGIGIGTVLRGAIFGPVVGSGLLCAMLLSPAAIFAAEGLWTIAAIVLPLGGVAYLAAFYGAILTREERVLAAGVMRRLQALMVWRKAPD